METSSSLMKLFPLLSLIDAKVVFYVSVGVIFVWLLLELAFWYVVEFILLPGLQKQNKPIVIDQCHPVDFIKKILNLLDSLNSYNITRYVEGFFHYTKLEDIHRDNFRSFLSWAMFGKSLDKVVGIEKEHLEEITVHIEGRYEELRTLKPGFNPLVKHCSFSLEPISYIHRPLFLYIAAGLTEFCFNVVFFRLRGYQSLELNGLNYWIKQGSVNNSQPPLIIFHGISPGWSLYGLLVKYLETERTVILIDFDSVKIKSMKFFQPTINQFVHTVEAILKRHHINKVALVGHSFGSIIAGWIVTKSPHIVTHLTLIDPVSLLLAFPDVAYSFLYKTPRTFFEWVIFLGASKEITVAYALYRNFCWHKNVLWLEDVPDHIGVVVGVGTSDEISDMNAVAEYVNNCSEKRKNCSNTNIAPITCVEWKDFHHGQVLLAQQTLWDFVSLIKSSEKAVNLHY